MKTRRKNLSFIFVLSLILTLCISIIPVQAATTKSGKVAVTQTQHQCLGCGKWFSSKNDLLDHAFLVQIGQVEGDPARCGSSSYDAVKEVVITPAKTERQLVKDAWDETQTYVDYQYCSGCGQHK